MPDPARRSTKVLPITEAAVEQAAAILRQGGLVVFPTETVYGLGANADDPFAVRSMFAAKGRPPDHPVIVHLADASLVSQFAADVLPTANKLAATFWPGPMTLILRRTSRVSDLVTGGLNTVGLRVPGHPVAQSLLRSFGGPIAAPSANRFGRVSPTRAEHVIADLSGSVDLILDGGECSVGLESTIIDLSRERPAILRPGAVTAEQVSGVLQEQVGSWSTDAPRVSGNLPSHYAPKARVEIVGHAEMTHRACELAAEGRRVAMLTAKPPASQGDKVVWIIIPQSAQDLAHELYALLRQVDALECNVALISLPEEEGLGAAIADRLRRAAGPRSEA